MNSRQETFNYMKFTITVKWAVVVLVCAGVLAIHGNTAATKENDPEKIVARVEKTLQNMKTLSCSFKQVYYRKVTDSTVSLSGMFFLKKPYLLRMENQNQTVVVDGSLVWLYVPRNNQVQISDFVPTEKDFPTPLSLFERYSGSGSIGFYGEEDLNDSTCAVLTIDSDEPGKNRVTVWIDRHLHFPVKTVEESPNGDTVRYLLKEVKLNEAIIDSVFTFTVPEGVEVIDLRE